MKDRTAIRQQSRAADINCDDVLFGEGVVTEAPKGTSAGGLDRTRHWEQAAASAALASLATGDMQDFGNSLSPLAPPAHPDRADTSQVQR